MKPDQPDLTSPDGEPRAANEPVAGPETMPSLEELLREAELKAAEHHDAWLRAKAEAENIREAGVGRRRPGAQVRRREVRRRSPRGEGQPRGGARGRERDPREPPQRGGAHAPPARVGARAAVDPRDRPGGPEVRPAPATRRSACSTSDKEPNTVVNVLQKGYLLHDRVLRPALVTVAKPRDA